jgi:regulator-associated protein of mTOR
VCFENAYIKLTQHDSRLQQIVSGTIEGDILFWDLRLPTPLRSLEIQRSAMTALACHPRIPILASGSDDFLKVCSADGDTLQAFRHHHKLQGRRIGRVSTLAFHPNAPLLAAGFTDDIISIYGT